MFDVAPQVQQWLAAGLSPVMARPVEVTGLGIQGICDVVVATADGSIGQVLGGAVEAQLTKLLQQATDGYSAAFLHDVSVSARLAAEAGLACAGRAQLLVQPARDVPAAAWEALAQGEPVCLVTDLDGERLGFTTWFIPGDASPDEPRHDPQIVRYFGRGMTASSVMQLSDGPRVLVSALWPTPQLVVVGDGLLAEALVGVATLLEWDARPVRQVDAAVEQVSRLRNADAVVVLSHDRETDGPVLSAALAGQVGYIGALGSRRTQQARAGWLRDYGVGESEIERVNGPAGLDIGSRTPGEIAVSIIAEIISLRTGTSGQALRERRGPIHVDGLNTPPPRYSR